MAANVFIDIGIIIIAASLFGYIAKLFRQPLIPSYIFAGFIIGPYILGFVTDIATITTLAEIGIAFMLFVVGLELEFKRIKSIGKYAFIGGSLHMALLFLLGTTLTYLATSYRGGELLYIGVFVLFSSTMVGVKFLSDKKELDSLHGRIIVGLLLVEDIVAVLAIAMLGGSQAFDPILIFSIGLKALALAATAMVLSRFIFPIMFRHAAKNQELLLLLSVATCFGFAIGAYFMQFSIIIGAFIAGVAIGNLPYRFEIESRVKGIRDFFATLFFVSIGTLLQWSSISSILIPLGLLCVLILFIKPLIITFLARLFRYSKRTAFAVGSRLAQTSEFSLIIATQGFALGHIGSDLLTLAVMLVIVTIVVSSYYSKHNNAVYKGVSSILHLFDFGGHHQEASYIPKNHKYEAVLIGYDRTGYGILRNIIRLKKKILVVDYNPEVIRRLMKQKIPCMYGDIGDVDILDRINFKQVDTVISTVPDVKNNALLTLKVKHENPKSVIFVNAQTVSDALDLYDDGADYVVIPPLLGGYHLSEMYEKIAGNLSDVLSNKESHIKQLKEHDQANDWRSAYRREYEARKSYKREKRRKNHNGHHE